MRTTHPSRVLTTSAAIALALTAFSITPAFADGSGSSGESLVRARLMGSTPAPVSPVIAGVNPGGAPWVNGPSPVRVRKDGRITVRISGLIIPARGNNPIPAVVATLVCGNMVASSTAPFTLSPEGNGATSDVISVPRECENPAVLIQPDGRPDVYIASAFGNEENDG
jgi:hypothetical protein